jgi:plastocyanin
MSRITCAMVTIAAVLGSSAGSAQTFAKGWRCHRGHHAFAAAPHHCQVYTTGCGTVYYFPPGTYSGHHRAAYGHGAGYGYGAGWGRGMGTVPQAPYWGGGVVQTPQRGYAGYGPRYDGRTDSYQAETAPQARIGADEPGRPVDAVISMIGMRFEPQRISIQVGDTVEWRNESNMAHTVTADQQLANNPENVLLPEGAQPFHSGRIEAGSAFRHTFTAPGTYQYVCLPHEEQGMLGQVIVEPNDGRQAGRRNR